MQIQKTVTVEKNQDAIMQELISVVTALKSGQSVSTVLLGELLKAGTLAQEGSAVPGEVAESVGVTLNTVLTNAGPLACAILGLK